MPFQLLKNCSSLGLARTALACSLAVCSAALAQSSAGSAAPDNVQALLSQPAVTVNGEVQSSARAEVLLREQLARGVADSPELRNSVRDALVNQAIMAQEARKLGLEKNPLVQAQIELAQQSILALAWQQTVLMDTRVSDEAVQAEYNSQVARLGKQEYLLRHVLVADQATARTVMNRLKAGAKMADLAAEFSRDSQSNGRGGLSEWTPVGNFLPPVAEAVAKLAKGKLAPQPVQTAQGWHVIQLEDTRAFTPPTLEASKNQIVDQLARQSLEAKVLNLKSAAQVK
jgi:peptidyl-prolyl cis-trans isomerase C